MSTHPDVISLPQEAADTPAITLGTLLRTTRQTQGLDLAIIAKETRISLNNLQAMEEDDFKFLPAEAFARGYYRIYAEILNLDSEEIAQRYEVEKPSPPPMTSSPQPVFSRHDPEVGLMAERSLTLPFSSMGLFFFILMFFGAFLCWYFSWNPASFLSHKLRSLENDPQRYEQVHNNRFFSENFSRIFGFTSLRSAEAAPSSTYRSNKLEIIIVNSNQKNSKTKIVESPPYSNPNFR